MKLVKYIMTDNTQTVIENPQEVEVAKLGAIVTGKSYTTGRTYILSKDLIKKSYKVVENKTYGTIERAK